MNKPYVPYELALKLKEAGYDHIAMYHYKVHSEHPEQHTNIPTYEVANMFGANHNLMPTRVSAPLWSEVCDWIYKTKGVIVFYSPAYNLETQVNEIETALRTRNYGTN